MKEEYKQILIKEAGARVSTNTYVKCIWMSSPSETFNHIISTCDLEQIKFGAYKEYKPYLRPMYTMSDSEKEQYDKLTKPYEKVDFLNKNHFDYRGLIEMNLAIAADKDVYKT